MPAGVTAEEVNFEDQATITIALKTANIQFLIITLSTNAPETLHSRIVQAAAEAGVQWIMPNSFSNDFTHPGLQAEDLYSASSLQKCEEIKAAGMSYVALACGFWYQWSLGLGVATFGIDIAAKKAVLFDDGRAKLGVSTWGLCGVAVAKLLSLPVKPEGESDGKEVCLEMWKNKPLFIASFHVSQREMLESVQRVLGDGDQGWTIVYEDSKERYEKAMGTCRRVMAVGF